MAENKTAYERLKARPKSEGFASRDVYEDQQFERGELQGKQSEKPWIIAAWVLAAIVFILTWIAVSFIDFGRINLEVNNKTNNKPKTAQTSTTGVKRTFDPNNKDNYIISETKIDPLTGMKNKYAAVDENGTVISSWYDNMLDVPQPDWYKTSKVEYEKKTR